VQLRRLELVGFKTFVDRTELELHPGITAIVGPNGSGKSNIFDGIRWALGETNARLLRGARMDDVIFSGSVKRRPHGLATVALTFDNGAGLLPLDFSEVTVSRTVARGGEGEYAINGVDCRLRDIHMLFLGTGLGGRSYSLIGQGEVDAVLRATPLERRYWLEEAAGLARHKRQRTEAERRLDRAQAHMDRLTDLTGELEVQQQALAVQAEAAARHRSYTEESQNLELALYADEARRLLGTMRRLSAQLAADRDQVAEADRRVAEAQRRVADLEASLVAATEAYEHGQQRLLDGAEALQAQAAEVQALDSQAEGLRGQLAHLDAEMVRVSGQRAGLSTDADELRQEVAAAGRRREDLAQALSSAEAELATAIADAESAEARLIEARDDAVELARTAAQTRSDLAALRAKEELLRETVRAGARKAGALADRAAALALVQETTRAACEDARRALLDAEAALTSSAQALDARRADVEAAAEQARAAELDEHRSRARLSSMEEAAAQFLGFEDGVREVLLAAQADPERFPGLRGAVADLIEVPAAHQSAIGAALGRRVHCLVVDDRPGVDAVLRFLQSEGRGSATVLAMNALRPRHPAPDLSRFNGDIIARGSEVAAPAHAPRLLVEALLGDVAIATDLDAAWRLFAAGYPGRIVTRDGVLLSPDGVLSIRSRVNGDMTPLGRSQLIAALRRSLAEVESQRQSAEARRAAAEAQAGVAADAARAARAGRDAAAAALAEHTQHLAHLESEASRIAQEEASQRAEIEAATQSLRRVEEEALRLDADHQHLEGETQRLEAHLESLQEEVRRRAAARDEAMGAVSARRVALVQHDGSLDALRIRLGDRTTALAELDTRWTRLTREAEQLRTDLEAMTTRRDDAAAVYEGLVAGQAAAKERVEQLGEERARTRDDLTTRHGEHAAAVGALHAAEAAMHRTEVRVAQADAELGAAASRLDEQYGITLEAASARRLDGSREDARRRLDDVRAALRELGPVNLRAIDEHASITTRLDALRAHVTDLQAASAALRQAITHINAALRVRFRETFDQVNEQFARLFERLFEGGQGFLELVEDELGSEPGLEVIAQLPGKKRRPLVALSGGERVLVALALIFAMLRVHPSPFCIFDEVEAALDDANTRRFTSLLRDLAQQTQVLIITHNKGTMAAADILYGVTMQEPGISSLVSVRLVPSKNGETPNGQEPAHVREHIRGDAREPQTVALPAE
jgi:chromosome segregation protein